MGNEITPVEQIAEKVVLKWGLFGGDHDAAVKDVAAALVNERDRAAALSDSTKEIFMADQDKFVKIRVDKQWGANAYYLPGISDRQVAFKNGQSMRIQWPNGQIQDIKVRIKIRNFTSPDTRNVSVHDAQEKVPVFNAELNGLIVEIPVASVKVRLSDCRLEQ